MSDKDLTQFAKRLAALHPEIFKEFMRRQKNELTRGIISFPQMIILEYLHKKRNCIMGDIA